MAYDANDPEDAKLVKEMIDKEVEGLKKKNNELIGREKEVKEKLTKLESQVEGLGDLTAIRDLLSKVENDEEGKLIKEGKIDQVVDRRTERMRKDFEKKLSDTTERASRAEAYAQMAKDQMVASQVRDAGIKAGMRPEALEDAVFRAKAAGFSLNDNGEAVVVKGSEVVLGKDGKTPLTPQEYLEELRERAPHLWPQAAGGGAAGGLSLIHI